MEAYESTRLCRDNLARYTDQRSQSTHPKDSIQTIILEVNGDHVGFVTVRVSVADYKED